MLHSPLMIPAKRIRFGETLIKNPNHLEALPMTQLRLTRKLVSGLVLVRCHEEQILKKRAGSINYFANIVFFLQPKIAMKEFFP